jgi:hypothetical protein
MLVCGYKADLLLNTWLISCNGTVSCLFGGGLRGLVLETVK